MSFRSGVRRELIGFGRGGELPLGSEEGADWLRAGPVSFRSGVQGDRGKVPLGLQETAKGECRVTQLAALKQVSSGIQRILPRAKRKPDPLIKALLIGSSPAAGALTAG